MSPRAVVARLGATSILTCVIALVASGLAFASAERIVYQQQGFGTGSYTGLWRTDSTGATFAEMVGGLTSSPPTKPSLSPDGQTVAYTISGDIYAHGTLGSFNQRIYDDPTNRLQDPRFSPDGTTLVFDREDSSKNNDRNLYRIGVDGTGLIRLVAWRGSQLNPTYSPDGARIAFDSNYTPTNSA